MTTAERSEREAKQARKIASLFAILIMLFIGVLVILAFIMHPTATQTLIWLGRAGLVGLLIAGFIVCFKIKKEM